MINNPLPRFLLFWLLLLSGYGVSAQSMLQPGSKILFVGNGKVGSEGGLHNHFKRTMERMDHPQIPIPISIGIGTDWISMYGMQTLDQMLTDELQQRIKTGDDDIIVVQNGDLPALETFAELITASGKQMIVYGVWPDNPFLEGNSFESFSAQTDSIYQELKQFENRTGIPVAPCGLTYPILMADRPNGYPLRPDFLFTPEGSNVNDLSCLVNVAMLYAAMTGNSPVGLPVWNPIATPLVEEIQSTTWQVYNQWSAATATGYSIGDTASGNGKQQKHIYPPELPAKEDRPANQVDFSRDPVWAPLLTDSSSIYYVGNSYIGTEGGLENHFPRLLREVGSKYQPRTRSSIFWGQGLQRMFTEEVRQNIKEGPEDIIVVTSGPREYLDKFREEIAAAGKQMVVHMTWGRNPTLGDMENYRETTMAIIRESRKFEDETGTPVVPCGLVYYDLITNPPEFDDLQLRQDWVFMEQNIHQNHLGTMVNAAAHYAVMTGQSPVGLPMWDPYPIELVHALQQRTWEIVQQWKSNQLEFTGTE